MPGLRQKIPAWDRKRKGPKQTQRWIHNLKNTVHLYIIECRETMNGKQSD